MAYLKAIVMTLGAYISRSFVDCNLFKWDALLLLTSRASCFSSICWGNTAIGLPHIFSGCKEVYGVIYN